MSRGNQLLAAAGPFNGVKTVIDAPYQDAADYLSYASNCYARDVAGASSLLGRPGFTVGSQAGGGQRTQGSHAHIDPATGTVYRFFVVNGVLYRSNTIFTSFTNVSPVGITIDNATATRVAFLSVGSSLVVTDGVNRPWVMSNFGGTPVTGAYIDIDGAGGAWTAFGPPTIYQDSVFFITATVPVGSAVQARVGAVWSEPNQPTVGYTQSGYADFWNFIETGSDPLTAVLGTNNGLFVWRENSITVASGTPSINFSSTATRDARGDGIGTLSPWSVAIFQNNIFFVDAQRRPWLMPLSGEPQPIWQQFNVTPAAVTPAQMATYVIGAIVTGINQYVVAFQIQTQAAPPTLSPLTASCFDATTGNYAGEWTIGSATAGVWAAFDYLGEQRDANGLPVFVICGGISGAGSGGWVWWQTPIANASWEDTGTSVINTVTTKPLGYSADAMMLPDRMVIVTSSSDPLSVTLHGTYGATTVTVTPVSANATFTSTYSDEFRATVGLDGQVTRSLAVTIAPTTSSSGAQWGVQRVELYGTRCKAGPEDA